MNINDALDNYIQQTAKKELFEARESALKELVADIHDMNPPENTTIQFKSKAYKNPLTLEVECRSVVKINNEDIEIDIKIGEYEFEGGTLSKDSLDKIVFQVAERLATRILNSNLNEIREAHHFNPHGFKR
jgi:hypothetical protein